MRDPATPANTSSMSGSGHDASTDDAPRLSEAFVLRWLECLQRSLRLEIEAPFALVKPMVGPTCRICAPLLSYSHLGDEQAAAIARGTEAARTVVRHLKALPADSRDGIPVVSMLDLSAWKNADDFWERGLSANLRKKIRRAQKSDHSVEATSTPEAAALFFRLFARTMHRHGTPPYPLALFETALAMLDAEVVIVRRGGQPVAAYFVLHDPEITLFQWAGFDEDADVGYASLLGEWAAIGSAFARGAKWFDLGRAPLGGPAWRHKQYWHPTLFHATTTPPPARNVYDKFRLASAVWKKLPRGIATRLGPQIIRHLPDA